MKEAPTVAILAGGFGTRMKGVHADLPKPMIPINGRPVLQHQIDLCSSYGFKNILILVHHKCGAIQSFFGDGSQFGLKISYSIESEPRGTAGALFDALPLLADQFIVLYGDTFLDVDLRKLWENHIEREAAATLVLHPNDHPYDSDLVEIDAKMTVRRILRHPHLASREVRNLVNAALYVFTRDAINGFSLVHQKSDIARDLFPEMIAAGCYLHGYVTQEYIKDMGTPERLEKVERDIANELPQKLSLRAPRRCVFIDRDGTLNVDVNHLNSPTDLVLLPGVPGAIKKLNQSGFLSVVVTNQPVVARGDVTLERLDAIHACLETQLGKSGAYLEAIYYCPHHPDKGFPGEVAALKIPCKCRKPEVGLIEKACKDMRIDKNISWLIGDSTVDIETGFRAGLKTILVRTGKSGLDGKYTARPDYLFSDLAEAVDWILWGYDRMRGAIVSKISDISTITTVFLVEGCSLFETRVVAQVIKEVLISFGRRVHLLSNDNWLGQRTLACDTDKILGENLEIAKTAVLNASTSYCGDQLKSCALEVQEANISPEKSCLKVLPNDVIVVDGVLSSVNDVWVMRENVRRIRVSDLQVSVSLN
jgi:histidinol-phosphate phosphatase family protein